MEKYKSNLKKQYPFYKTKGFKKNSHRDKFGMKLFDKFELIKNEFVEKA